MNVPKQLRELPSGDISNVTEASHPHLSCTFLSARRLCTSTLIATMASLAQTMIYVSGPNSQISCRQRLLGSTTPCSKLFCRHQPHRCGILRMCFAKGWVIIPALRVLRVTTNTSTAAAAIVSTCAMMQRLFRRSKSWVWERSTTLLDQQASKRYRLAKRELKSGGAPPSLSCGCSALQLLVTVTVTH